MTSFTRLRAFGRLASLTLLLAQPASALSPIHARPVPSVLVPASAGGVAGALPLAGISLTPSLGPGAGPTLALPPSLLSAPGAPAWATPALARADASLPLLRGLGETLVPLSRAEGLSEALGLQTLGAFWDGGRARPARASAVVANAAPSLVAAKPRDQEFLSRAAETARESPTARAILDKIDAFVAKRGEPIRVNVRDLKNNWGEYDYIRDVLEINSRFRGDPRQAAPTLAHELLHILQHAEKIPAEALEMELEAHIV